LSAAGKFNYYGTKKWLEDQAEPGEGLTFYANTIHFQSNFHYLILYKAFGKIDLDEVSFGICLDSLANGEGIYMHVSRPPKDNHPASDFMKVSRLDH
jgi:hypothetical protein